MVLFVSMLPYMCLSTTSVQRDSMCTFVREYPHEICTLTTLTYNCIARFFTARVTRTEIGLGDRELSVICI